MVLRNWRIYARLDDNKNPIEFSCVSCILHETTHFVLWKLSYGTREQAMHEVRRQTNLHIEKAV